MDVKGPRTDRRSRPLSFGHSKRRSLPPPTKRSYQNKNSSNPTINFNFKPGIEKTPNSSADRKDASSIIKDFFSIDMNIDSIIDRIKEFSGKSGDSRSKDSTNISNRTKNDITTKGTGKGNLQGGHQKWGKRISLEELDKVETEVELLLQDIEMLEKELIHKPSNPPAISNGPKLQEKAPFRLRIFMGRGLKIDIHHTILSWVRSNDLKRYIPIIFAIMAPLIYFLLTLRVVFDAPISRIIPIYIEPFHLLIILVVILIITAVANSIRRYRIKNSGAKASPIWNKEVDQG